MREDIQVHVNDAEFSVPQGCTVAVAIAIAGVVCRTSVSGEKRGPLCGMGICFECRMTINGISHTRSCQVVVEPGMDIRTNE